MENTSLNASQPTIYAVVDYMFVGPEKDEAAYLATEKLWQRRRQKAVDRGICPGWYLNRVENGGRAGFVTIRIYDSPEKMTNPLPDGLTADLYTAEEQARMQKTAQTRDLIRSELRQSQAATMKPNDGNAKPYSIVHSMKTVPGKAEAYHESESQLFRKIQQTRVDAGQLKAWFFMSRAFPSGMDSKYDCLTVNEYEDKEASEKSYDMDKIRTALAEQEINRAPTIGETRHIVREEIWPRVMRTEPSEQP